MSTTCPCNSDVDTQQHTDLCKCSWIQKQIDQYDIGVIEYTYVVKVCNILLSTMCYGNLGHTLAGVILHVQFKVDTSSKCHE